MSPIFWGGFKSLMLPLFHQPRSPFSFPPLSPSLGLIGESEVSFVGMEACVSSLWVCLPPFRTRTRGAVCIDKTYEYLSGAIYHLTPARSVLLCMKQYSLCFSFCVSAPRSYLPSMSTMWPLSSRLSLRSLTSTSTALSSPVFFSSARKVKDTLPLFRQFFSSAFSLTYVSLASMKLPPDVLRYFLFSIQMCCLLILEQVGSVCSASPPLSFRSHTSPQGSANRVNLQPTYQ